MIGDAGQLQQVFLNLIANALDAMPDGGTLRVGSRGTGPVQGQASEPQRSRAGASGDGSVEVSVTDTGRGIVPEHLGQIFEPFFTTKGMGEGTGLGLSICQRIIKEHGGKIEVTSGVGTGATFRIILPSSQG